MEHAAFMSHTENLYYPFGNNELNKEQGPTFVLILKTL